MMIFRQSVAKTILLIRHELNLLNLQSCQVIFCFVSLLAYVTTECAQKHLVFNTHAEV